jgi:hypothetical protein
MLGKVLTIGFILATMLLVIILQTTTPATIGPLGILFVFVLMYMSVLSALTFLLFIASKLVAKLALIMAVRRPVQPISLGKSYYYSSVAALAPVMLIGMQSVGEVGFYDILLILVFVIISCVYIAKRTA